MRAPSVRRPRNEQNQALYIVRLVFGLIGVPLCIGALVVFVHTHLFLASASRTEGKVIELIFVEPDDDDSNGTWRPLVRFQPPAGAAAVEFSTSSSSNPPGYAVGETVGVFFDPQNPKNAKIDGFFALWGIPLILGLVGLLFGLVSLLMHQLLRNEARAKRRRPR